METIICKKCKEEKPTIEFTLNRNSKTSYEPYCKPCRKEHLRLYQIKYRKELKEKRKEKYEANAKKYSESTKKYSDELRKNNPAKWRTRKFFEKLKNIETDLTKEYIENLFANTKQCECCNKKMELHYLGNGEKNDNAPSIDRVDSVKGYTKNNIGVLCWKCNYRKTDLSLTDLNNLINYINKKQNV